MAFYAQAVKRPWDEDPFTMSEEVMKNISLEVVRERLLDHVHQVELGFFFFFFHLFTLRHFVGLPIG